MGKRLQQGERRANGQQANEKVPNVIGHQRNANQNQNAILGHTHQVAEVKQNTELIISSVDRDMEKLELSKIIAGNGKLEFGSSF